jgi:nucleoside-diphosphate-sugar epimerase
MTLEPATPAPAEPGAGALACAVLVTGGSGFLGGRLVTRLLADGATVTCTTRIAGRSPDTRNVTWRVCDLTDERAVRALFTEVTPEVVFHLAGHVSGLRDAENVVPTLVGNLVSSVNVLLAALAAGSRRVVLAGSYEEPESDATPRSPYAASKIGATGYARMFASLYGLSTIVLRPAMIYGPGQRDGSKLIPYVTRCFLAGEAPVLGSGKRPIDWVYVDDVVDAFVSAATAEGLDGEVIDVGSGELHTITEVVEILASETCAMTGAQFGGLADRPSEHVTAADTERARRLLGWTATTSLTEGLALTVKAVRSTLERDRAQEGAENETRRFDGTAGQAPTGT